MAKYQRLTSEELQSLEKEFVNFMVLNGITGEDWIRMKNEEPEKSDEMIDIFSDMIWESTLQNMVYLDHVTKHSIKCFFCSAEKIMLVGMDSSETDLTQLDLDGIRTGEVLPSDIKVYTTDKSYAKKREEEIYDMLGWGCQRSDGQLYKTICLAL